MAVSDLNLSPVDVAPAERLYFNFTVAEAVLTTMCLGAYVLSWKPPFDAMGYLIGRDFINTWLGGHAALAGEPAKWFDHDAYNSLLRGLFGPSFPPHNWSYPPHLLLFTWPLGLLPYFAAFTAWSVAGFGLFLRAAANGERRADRLLFLAVS